MAEPRFHSLSNTAFLKVPNAHGYFTEEEYSIGISLLFLSKKPICNKPKDNPVSGYGIYRRNGSTVLTLRWFPKTYAG